MEAMIARQHAHLIAILKIANTDTAGLQYIFVVENDRRCPLPAPPALYLLMKSSQQ